MRKILIAVASSVLLSTLARAEEPHRRGQVRVYVYDAERRPVPPANDGRVYFDLKGGGRRLLKLQPVAARGAPTDTAVHQGGQLRPLRAGQIVELLVLTPDEAAVRSSSVAHLAADADLEDYSCPMKCATALRPGECPKCGMEMKPSLIEFQAVVALKLGDEWVNAKGFTFPAFETPRTFREAVDKLVALTAEIGGLVEGAKLDRVHEPALNVAAVAKVLVKVATEAKLEDPALAPVAARLEALGPELDGAADAGRGAESVRLLADLRTRVETLKSIAR